MRFLPAAFIGGIWLLLTAQFIDQLSAPSEFQPGRAIFYVLIPFLGGLLTIGLPVLCRHRSYWTDRVRWATPLISMVLLVGWFFNAGGGV